MPETPSFISNTWLRLRGYRYAVCPKTNCLCYRLHKVGCANLRPKRVPVTTLYFKTISAVLAAKGHAIKDKDIFKSECCFTKDAYEGIDA